VATVDWNKLKDLVADALEVPEDQRAAFLRERCGDDERLLAESMSLVGASESSTGMIDVRTDAWLGLGGPDLLSLGGQKVGQYQLQTLLAEGAMAAVYRAKQIRPERDVALKMFRSAMQLTDARRRFRREADVLARLQHPHIARIYEAGVHQTGADEGVPFIAMEFIDGLPLTTYAVHEQLSRDQKIELLLKVIDAVQAAHQQAIIHRDLKPANILVDKSGSPKVLDFGIAMIASPESRLAQTFQTTAGVLLGTPGYMSPEQASGNHDDIDTRTDVWALGVLLFELLTGKLPIETKGKSITEILRQMESATPATLSSVDPTLRGDLETIVATALSRDKQRRYASAAALGDDLRRFQRHEPIAARPPTRRYLLRMFVKRNRPAIAVGAIIVGLLVGGIVSSSVGFLNASRERDRAIEAKKEAAIERDRAVQAERSAALERDNAIGARNDAARERDRAVAAEKLAQVRLEESEKSQQQATTINTFLIDVLRSPDPNLSGRDVTVLSRLKAMEPSIAARFKDAPTAEAELRSALGQTYFELGEYHMAHDQQVRSLELVKQHNAPGSEAEMRETARLIQSLRWLYKPDEARKLNDEYLARCIERFGENNFNTLSAVGQDAGIADDVGDYRAIAGYERAIRIADVLIPSDPDALWEKLSAMNNLGLVYLNMGLPAEGEKWFRQAGPIRAEKYGAENVVTLTPNLNLAESMIQQNKQAEAEPIIDEILARSTRLLGEGHATTLGALRRKADIQESRGDTDAALDNYKLAIERSSQSMGEASPFTMTMRANRARLLSRLDRDVEAAAEYEQTIHILTKDSTGDEVSLLDARRNYAVVLGKLKRHDEALSILQDVLAKSQRLFGDDSQRTVLTKNNLGTTLIEAGKPEQAELQIREALVLASKYYPPEGVAQFQRNLARALVASGKLDEAKSILDESWKVIEQSTDPILRRRSIEIWIQYCEAKGDQPGADLWRTKLDAAAKK
jgi:eukaryotic-like serine/threonine-protein kinase